MIDRSILTWRSRVKCVAHAPVGNMKFGLAFGVGKLGCACMWDRGG